MAAVSLFRGSNMAVLTSCEKPRICYIFSSPCCSARADYFCQCSKRLLQRIAFAKPDLAPRRKVAGFPIFPWSNRKSDNSVT